jgi:hypothetical protein
MLQLHDTDPYWTHNLILGEGEVQGQNSLIRLHLHQSEEPAYRDESLFPIAVKRGDTRTTFTPSPTFLFPR